MKLPSLENLYNEASVTLKRFPFVLLSSFLGAGIMIYLIGLDYMEEENYKHLYSAVMACALGIPLFLSLTLHGEINRWGKPAIYAVQGIFLIVLIGYYISLPRELTSTDMIRFALFVLTLHLLVSLAPFILRNEVNGFWHYNEIFFIRFLTAVLYSGVLFGGLAIAIVSFDQLFDMNIDDEIYPQLFFFIAGVFNTWFFLAGVPVNIEKLNEAVFYPKGLKIFTQYVLLPLVTVYLLILYLYMGKIILEWNWPIGWVSNLVLGFSITGIFSILLIYPVRNREGNKWINTFSRLFYIALFPLIILLLLAILRRIDEYGITENRYFVFILALWLTGIALYFTFSRSKNIKIIPATLCIIAFLSSFGPWGAFSVSINSQVNRLEDLLVSNNILVNGKIVKAETVPEDTITYRVSSILYYLKERDALHELQPWFSYNFAGFYNTDSLKNREEEILMQEMGLTYSHKMSGDYYYINYSAQENSSLNVKDYDYLYNFSTFNLPLETLSDEKNIDKKTGSFKIDSVVITLRLNDAKNGLIILRNMKDELLLDVMRIIKERNITGNDNINPELMTIEAENSALKIKLMIKYLYGERREEKSEITNLGGILLVKLK